MRMPGDGLTQKLPRARTKRLPRQEPAAVRGKRYCTCSVTGPVTFPFSVSHSDWLAASTVAK